MNPEQREFLNLRHRPARLTAEQTAWVLGFQVHDMAPLISSGLLRPLGRPSSNAPKHFASADLDACLRNRKWLARATGVVQAHWGNQNARRPRRRTHTDAVTSNRVNYRPRPCAAPAAC